MTNNTDSTPSAARLNVYTTETYQGRDGEDKTSWTRIGVAFPLKNREGFSVKLNAFPVDGKLVMLPPQEADEAQPAATAAPNRGAPSHNRRR